MSLEQILIDLANPSTSLEASYAARYMLGKSPSVEDRALLTEALKNMAQPVRHIGSTASQCSVSVD